MLVAFLYLFTAALLCALAARYVRSFSRTAAIVLVLLPLCFTGRALLTGRIYAPVEMSYLFQPLRDHGGELGVPPVHDKNLFDIAFQILPWREALRECVAKGEWPLLNRNSASGDLLAPAMQVAAYSPFTWIALIPAAPESFTFTGSIAFFVAGLGMFLFARELGASEKASLVAAIAFMFSGPIAFQILWPVGFAWTLLPFVLTAVHRIVHRPSMRSMLLLTIALVLEITAGHPETILHVVAIGAVYGLFEFVRVRDWRGVALAVLAGIVALMLTAIVLLPFFDATTQTVDHQIRVAWSKSPLPVVPGSPRAALIADLFPFTRNNLAARAEAGSIVLALALFGVWVGRKQRESWLFVTMIVVGLYAGSQAWPLAQVMHKIPPFNMAMNDRLTVLVPFCLAVFSAFAIDALTRRAAIVMFAVFLVVAIGAYVFHGPLLDPARTVAELVPLAIAAVLVFVAPRHWIALVALILAQRIIADGNLIPTNDPRIAFPRTPIFAPMLRAQNDAPFRIVGTNGVLLPNTSTMYGLEDARGTTPMTFALLDETAPLWCNSRGGAFANLSELTRPMLSMLNVRFALSYAGEVPPQSGWHEVILDSHTRLLENERVLPRAYVPRRVVYADELEAMRAETDFAERSWINISGAPGDQQNGAGKIVTTEGKLGYDLDASMESGGWVVVSETAWRGWRAYVDGAPVKVSRANHAFLALYVPVGHHRVRLVFLPNSFVVGRAVTGATAFLLLIGCRLWVWRCRSRRSASTPVTPR